MLASSFIGHQWTLTMVTALGVIITLTIIVASVRLAFLGNRFAIFTLVASAAALLSYMQRALLALQINSTGLVNEEAFHFGFLFMLLCLTLGLGFEIRNR